MSVRVLSDYSLRVEPSGAEEMAPFLSQVCVCVCAWVAKSLLLVSEIAA